MKPRQKQAYHNNFLILIKANAKKSARSAKIKNDKVDARVLASLLRGGLVAECYVPPRDVRELRALVRHRVQLVKSAGMVKNHVHSLLDRYGFRREFSDLFGKAGLEWLKRLELKPLDRLLLDSFVQQIECFARAFCNCFECIIVWVVSRQ